MEIPCDSLISAADPDGDFNKVSCVLQMLPQALVAIT